MAPEDEGDMFIQNVRNHQTMQRLMPKDRNAQLHCEDQN